MCRNFRARFSSWCLNRISTQATVAVRPASGADPKARLRSAEDGETKETPLSEGDPKEKASSRGWTGVGRRIVIVVDPATTAAETRSAIQWALTHAVQPNDTLLLLCVCKPTAGGNAGPKRSIAKVHAKEKDLLQSMKNLCRARNPQVEVQTSLVEGKEKGPTIVGEARKEEASLLILGQRKRSLTWRLLMTWAGERGSSSGNGGFVEYCIQHAHCMTLAVRKKGGNVGGYLLTTKKHKDFWLLA
ncbi:uncharacterized protein LOC116259231 [Nymphaea colorata]|nr:uncharacterized protein LOC116259231 [Nymphaea colorata]